MKPYLSTLDGIMDFKSKFIGSQISFVHNDSLGDLLGFDLIVLNEQNNLSPKTVDKLLSEKNFLESNDAQGLTFKGRRSRVNCNSTMDVSPGYKYIEAFRRGVQSL